MIKKAEEYRAKAKECEERAARTRDPHQATAKRNSAEVAANGRSRREAPTERA
jgi:hypothetical protein